MYVMPARGLRFLSACGRSLSARVLVWRHPLSARNDGMQRSRALPNSGNTDFRQSVSGSEQGLSLSSAARPAIGRPRPCGHASTILPSPRSSRSYRGELHASIPQVNARVSVSLQVLVATQPPLRRRDTDVQIQCWVTICRGGHLCL